MHPLSPALSACDSLADIEDLDAFLSSKGTLSHWPTPPLTAVPRSIIRTRNLPEPDFQHDADQSVRDYYYTATILAGEAGFHHTTANDIFVVQDLLCRAEADDVIIAIALNIVSAWRASISLKSNSHAFSVDLLLVGALDLAVSYVCDHPPTSAWWSKRVCEGRWTPQQVATVVLEVLEALDWSLHGHASPESVSRSMRRLSPGQTSGAANSLEYAWSGSTIANPSMLGLGLVASKPAARDRASQLPPQIHGSHARYQTPVMHAMEDLTAHWRHGQLTPKSENCRSAIASTCVAAVEPGDFLRLL